VSRSRWLRDLENCTVSPIVSVLTKSAVLAWLVVSLAAGRAHADARGVRLDFARGEGAGDCPDRTALERAVADQLGRDPFGAPHRLAIEGIVVRQGDELVATFLLRALDGEPLGRREIRARGDCTSLTRAMELALVLAIDELAPAEVRAEVAEPVPPEAPAAPESARIETVPPVREARAESVSVDGLVSLSALLSIGVLPRPAIGIGLGAGIEVSRRWVAELAIAYFPTVEVETAGSRYSFGWTSFSGSAGVSIELDRFALAVLGGIEVGVLDGFALERPSRDAGSHATVAPFLALRLRFHLLEQLAIEAGGRGTVALVAHEYLTRGSERAIHQLSAIGFSTFLGLTGRFGAAR
jgi:hypothetical protein